MLNQVVIVGRIVAIQNEEEELLIKVKIPKMDSNEEPVIVDTYMSKSLRDNVIKYCNDGDLVGIKGMLDTRHNRLAVLAAKVTFLSSSHSTEGGD